MILMGMEILVIDNGLSIEAKELLKAKDVSIWLARGWSYKQPKVP